jgi:Ti-type conjugative transfer relaxase TraA
MAIEFARLRYVKRSDGGNACRSAAYNARADIPCERTGERFYFAHRDASLDHEVLLPDGADARFADIATLWNEAQRMERRKDSQEAKEVLLAMPTDAGLDLEDWKIMAAEFSREHFVSKGVAVQLDIHAPHDGDVNVHAHLLITTRRIEGERFSATKARDLDPEVRTMKGGMKAVTEAERWGVLWRDYQNRYFERRGLDIRVDEVGAYAQRHEGPVRLRSRPTEADERAQATREANEAAARDPKRILETLTQRRATFTELDIERQIKKHIPSVAERAKVREQVLAQPEVVALHDKSSGSFAGIYTTRKVRDQERRVLDDAGKIASSRQALDTRRAKVIARDMTLDPEQEAAFAKATGTDGFVVIEGLAGAGKSHSLNAIRQAHEQSGWRVVGLAPTNTAAQDLRRAGFSHGSTAHLELFYQENGRHDRAPVWDRRTLVVVDEAAMLDTNIYARMMRRAAETGAKVILAGDDRQLSSVERGGMFTVLKERHGSALIAKVRRQESDWQRTASEDFSQGRVAEGLRAYAEHGHVHWSKDLDESRSRLLSDWDQDSRARPDANRFVYAGTNREVNRLNRELRDIRLKRGEVKDTLEVETVRGKLMLGVGDRVQFHGNDRRAGIYNGSLATVEKIEDARIRARIDGGQVVEWDSASFKEYAYGYAGTIYRGQGRTQTDVYALYDSPFAWNARTAYVGMTRHKSRIELYVSNDLAPDEIGLAKRMSRQFRDEASLAWATPDEVRGRTAAGKEAGKAEIAEGKVPGKGETAPTPTGRFPREEIDALRRLDLTEYARDVHSYGAKPDPSGERNRFVLERTNAGGKPDRLEVRRAADGHWTFRDPGERYRRGDIFDLAIREGAPNLEAARKDVAAYQQGRGFAQEPARDDAGPVESRGLRQRYDKLRQAQAEALDKAKDRGAATEDKPLTFTKDRGKEAGVEKDKGDGAGLKFVKDRGKDDDRSR